MGMYKITNQSLSRQFEMCFLSLSALSLILTSLALHAHASALPPSIAAPAACTCHVLNGEIVCAGPGCGIDAQGIVSQSFPARAHATSLMANRSAGAGPIALSTEEVTKTIIQKGKKQKARHPPHAAEEVAEELARVAFAEVAGGCG
ncbi:hypothetical protein C8J57DRAFT_1573968 [Mycena rebaudengoi]|nr:hypothetical protein C8J57DRAFT_1573968 [Mycena rebaudengoi]